MSAASEPDTSSVKPGVPFLIAAIIFAAMFPVTALVPVLQDVTGNRYPEITVFQKHLFMSVNMIGAFLFAPLAGLLSDTLQKRRLLIGIGFFINAAALLLMRLEWSYPIYLSLRFMEGCGHITSLSLLMTLAIDATHGKNRGAVMGIVGTALTLGVAAGAPIGGIIGDHAPLSVFIFGGVLMLALGFISLLFLRDFSSSADRQPLHQVFSSLKARRLLAVPYVFTFVDRLTVGFIISTMTLYLRNKLHASPAEIGFILTMFLLPFALLTYPSGRLSKRCNKLKMMLGGSFLYGLVLMSIGFAHLGTIPWLMLAGGVAAALMFAPSLVLTSNLATPDTRASAMAGFNTAGSLGFLLGPVFGGSAVTFFSHFGNSPYGATFVLAGAMELLCVFVFLPFVRRLSY